MPVDPSLLPKIIEAAKRRFDGADTIHMGNETLPIRRISWGSIELDIATWGGAPMGRMVRIWGPRSSGKSLLNWCLFHQAQIYDGLACCYYNAEGQYDPDFTRDKMGVDISKMPVIEGGVIEDMVLKLQGLLGASHIHTIDSVGHTLSRERIETAPGQKMSRASKSRAWSDLLPDIQERMDKYENMVVFIDQVRTHQKYGHDIPSGANIFDHASSMDLHVTKVANLYRGADGEFTATRPQRTNLPTMGGEILIDGIEIGVEVSKSRVCKPFGKARLRLDLETMQFDRVFELRKVGVYLRVIEQSGSYYKVPTSDKTLHGEKQLRERLMVDDALVMQIFAAKDKFLKDHGYGNRNGR